jgi:hypothetical protein
VLVICSSSQRDCIQFRDFRTYLQVQFSVIFLAYIQCKPSTLSVRHSRQASHLHHQSQNNLSPFQIRAPFALTNPAKNNLKSKNTSQMHKYTSIPPPGHNFSFVFTISCAHDSSLSIFLRRPNLPNFPQTRDHRKQRNQCHPHIKPLRSP